MLPLSLHYHSSAYFSGTTEVKFEKGNLFFRFSLYHMNPYLLWEKVEIKSPGAWLNFYRSMVNSTNWERNYNHPAIMDGTNWELDLKYPDMHIQSSGYHRWPDDFDNFIEGLKALGIPLDRGQDSPLDEKKKIGL